MVRCAKSSARWPIELRPAIPPAAPQPSRVRKGVPKERLVDNAKFRQVAIQRWRTVFGKNFSALWGKAKASTIP